MSFSDYGLRPAVHHPAGCHAAPEGSAGAAHAHDRGQHPTAAAGAAADPGGVAAGAGPGPAGECCLLLSGGQMLTTTSCIINEVIRHSMAFTVSENGQLVNIDESFGSSLTPFNDLTWLAIVRP